MIAIAFLTALLPSLLMYMWIRKRYSDKPGYSDSCKSAFIGGFTVTVPVVLLDIVLVLIGYFTHLSDISEVLWEFYRTFLMFAFAEELWKFVCFKGILKKTKCEYSWYDVTAFMTLVGLGFEVIESIVLCFTMSPIQSIVRGITMMHGVFGFIMGYFYGKGLYTGKKINYVLSFLIPYLYHAIYDFTLSSSLDSIDWIAIIPVTLAMLSVVLLIGMFVFFVKARKNEKYTAPLVKAE